MHHMLPIVETSKIPRKESIQLVSIDKPVAIYKTCKQLEDVCEENNGAGFAAVQSGISLNLFVIKGDGSCPFITKGSYGYFANCQYESIGDDIVDAIEGCLSLKLSDGSSRYFQVKRHKIVKVSGLRLIVDENSRIKFIEFNQEIAADQQGIVFQHELDHSWKGILISEIGKEILLW